MPVEYETHLKFARAVAAVQPVAKTKDGEGVRHVHLPLRHSRRHVGGGQEGVRSRRAGRRSDH
jgi:hypothetical protein